MLTRLVLLAQLGTYLLTVGICLIVLGHLIFGVLDASHYRDESTMLAAELKGCQIERDRKKVDGRASMRAEKIMGGRR